MIEAPETEDREESSLPSGFVLAGLRWWILGLVFTATVINILDRLSVSVLAPVIRERLHLSSIDYGEVGTWFLLAYTISQGLSGLMHDRIGAKRGFAVSVTVWSASALMHAFARGFTSLCLFRTLLGLGEGGNWPGGVKVITDWFPARERAFALGIINSGSSVGAIMAPPLVIWLQLQFGWQSAFVATGALGFLWLIGWLVLYRSSAEHPWLGRKELEHIRAGQEQKPEPSENHPPRTRWIELLAVRQVWAIVLSRLAVDPIWWLYILWLPQYLTDSRGMSLKQIGLFASLPFIAAGIGGLVGGGLSGYLIGRGWSTDRARKTVIIIATFLPPCGILAARAETAVEAIAWISVVTFGFQVWINNVQILPSDIFPSYQVASVAGLGGIGAGIGSMAFTLATGWVVQHFSYTPILVTAGLLCPLGTLVLFLLLGRIEPLYKNAALPIH
jgi:ACS family hexuronate transporter-like MFS transporter